ncbi:MAG TPA: T9SS type A sorting domain-containing protein, partial [Bacteroidia bacterium]|nr:T9SS type A sorting domain-containing protein [Bacteroidia bacterium]
TYYGSSGDDISFSCVNDVVGNVYFLGVTTSSNNIATPGSHQQTYSKDYDIYLTKLNTNGNRQWSTYYGHDSIDVGLYIHCDTLNSDLYFSGYSKSTTSISTIGAHQSINSGGPNDAILVKFDTSGVRQWATYYGGNDIDWGNAVVTDNSGVYLCGYTTSSVSIATPNALQLNFIGNGGNSDAFIAKFNKAGGRLWGTYYGGTSVDVASSIQLDKLGDIYIAGVTGSGGLATVGSYQSSINGVFDGLCAKFSQSASLVINESFYENTFLSIFPNPNSGSFTIQTKVDVVLEIVNELGQVVRNIKLDASNNHQTNITGLADGVYCLKDKLSGTIIKNKIVVVR